MLVPDERRRLDLYRTAITDKAGRFAFAEIPPGSYRVFCWEAIEPNGYYDPDVLSRYETRGRPIILSASSNDTIEVTIIPVE